jgi:hypothetical protein
MLKPAELIELTVENDLKLPSIEGRLFCSRRNPEREAALWIENHRQVLKSARQVSVLGLGAGFHIVALPTHLEIQVIELRPQLIARWQEMGWGQNLPNTRITLQVDAAKVEGPILEFRPAWSGLEAQYETMSRNLRGVHRSALENEAERKDLWILAQALQKARLPENLELTIKDIVNLIPIENQSEEARLWRALRELVA